MLLDLPPALLTRILVEAAAAAPHTLLSFGATCKAGRALARDDHTSGPWGSLCAALVARLPPGRWPAGPPSAWGAASHAQLALGLLLPYGSLLAPPAWCSQQWPDGLVVVVDAEPPRLVARSLHWRSLNGGPHCHELFELRLPPPGSTPGPASVTCCRQPCAAAPAGQRAACLEPSAGARAQLAWPPASGSPAAAPSVQTH